MTRPLHHVQSSRLSASGAQCVILPLAFGLSALRIIVIMCTAIHVHSFASYEHGPRCARSASFAALAVLRSAQRVAAPRRGFATVSFAPPCSPAQPRLSAAPLGTVSFQSSSDEEKLPLERFGATFYPPRGKSSFRLADPRIGCIGVGYTKLSLTPTGVPNES